MKRNYYAAYDFIRQEKFVTPEKIQKVEELLKTNNVIINWWCRQSGKTLTSVKITRDILLNKPGANVLVITPKVTTSHNFIESLARTIDRKRRKNSGLTLSSIELDNESKVIALSGTSAASAPLVDTDLIVIEEFEWINDAILAAILIKIKRINEPDLAQRFINMINFKKPQKLKVLFASSKHNGNKLEMITASLKDHVINYLNWEQLPNLNKERLVQSIGEDHFEIEYNSYKK